MGTTTWHNLPFCVDALRRIAPQRVLDLNVGVGRWGMLAHDFCNGECATEASEQPPLHVAGITNAAGKLAEHLAALYERIYVGDAGTLVAQLPGPWDVTICDGLLNQLDKDAARRLLEACLAKSTYVLVRAALGAHTEASPAHGRAPHSLWEAHEFLVYPLVRRALFEDHAGQPWGTFILSQADPRELREALSSGTAGDFNALEVGHLPPDFERVLRRVEDMRIELQHIKGHWSYRQVQRLRTSGVWNALRWLRNRNRRIAFVRALGSRNPAAGGCEVWLMQVSADADGPPVPWDVVERGGGWTLRPEVDSAFGHCLLAERGWLRIPVERDPELHFLRYPWAGEVEIVFQGRRQVVDLYAAHAERVAVYPAREPIGMRIVDRPRQRPLPFMDVAAPRPPALVERTPQEDEAFIEAMRQANARVIAVHCPRWLGVSSSTQALFPHTYTVPEDSALDPQLYDPSRLERHARVLAATGAPQLVFSGGDEIHLLLAALMRRLNPGIRCDMLWHGSYAHFSEEYNWRILRLWMDAVRAGRIHSIGTVKKGMERFLESLGVRARLVLNYVPGEPQPPAQLDDAEYQLGLWVSGVNQLKLPNAMLAAVQMTPRSRLHAAGLDPRARAIVEYLKIPTATLHEKPLPHADLLAAIRRTHLSLYVTFSECCPMLPLESLQVGVPCLIGPTSHLFEDNRLLFERLVVPFPDRADVIADYIARALADRAAIMAEYLRYIPSYNQRARESVDAFLA